MIDLSFLLAMGGTVLLIACGTVAWFTVVKPRQRLRMEREHHRRKREGR